jgi:hypothetical protein
MKKSFLSVVSAAVVLAAGSLPAFAQTAQTDVLLDETITNVPTQKLPTPPVLTAKYTLPMVIQIVKDASITTDTPITDQYKTDLPRWSEAVRACLKSKPVFVRVVGDKTVPFIVNGSQGTLKLNANNKPVCPTTAS